MTKLMQRMHFPLKSLVQDIFMSIYESTLAQMGEERSVYRVLVGKPEGKRPLGRPRHRWEDNVRKDLQQVGCGAMDWIGLAQDRDRWQAIVNAVMNLRDQ